MNYLISCKKENYLAGFIPILPNPPNAQTAIATPKPIRIGATTGPYTSP